MIPANLALALIFTGLTFGFSAPSFSHAQEQRSTGPATGQAKQMKVLGILPGSEALEDEVVFWGGEAHRLLEALPPYPDHSVRQLRITSDVFTVYIHCTEYYQHPMNATSGEDTLCRVGYQRARNTPSLDLRPDELFPISSSFPLPIAGIMPGHSRGHLVSFYGGQTSLIGERWAQPLTFREDRFALQFVCSREYQRPTNGEIRQDFLCSIFLAGR